MAAVIAVNPKLYFPSCPGGKVDVYLAGTTTRSNTWQDRDQITLNQNPIQLDSRGECVAWLDSSKRYKFVVKNSSNVAVYTVDNVAGAQPGAASVSAFTVDRFSGTGSPATYTLSVTPGSTSTVDVYVNGVYQQKNSYTLVGTSLTLTAASGTNNVEAVTRSVLDYTDVSADVAANVVAADLSATASASSATAAAASATAADLSADDAAAHAASAAAVSGAFVGLTRSAIKALNTTTVQLAYLKETGREGEFAWDSSDQSSFIAVASFTPTGVSTSQLTYYGHQLDTGSAIYVTSSAYGLTPYTLYWVGYTANNTFKLADSFTNAKAGVWRTLTVTSHTTVYRHADPHEGRFLIPTGLRCDGSQGAWVRDTPDEGVYNLSWWGLDTAFAHNQAIITSALHACPDGATLVGPDDTFPVSRYVQMRWREGQTLKGNGWRFKLEGDGVSASSLIRIMKSGSTVDGVAGGKFTGQVSGDITPTDASPSESAGVQVYPTDGDYLENITVRNCRFYQMDVGTIIGSNFDDNGTLLNPTHVKYYIARNCRVHDNYFTEINYHGIELFNTERVFVHDNLIYMTNPVVDPTTSIGIRICGCVHFTIYANRIYGYGEVSGYKGMAIEAASMADSDAAGIRDAGIGQIYGNYTEKVYDHYAIAGSRGHLSIFGNTAVGDPDSVTSTTANTAFLRQTNSGFAESLSTLNSNTITTPIASPGVVNWTGHPLINGDTVKIYTNGTLPTEIVSGTTYYVVNRATNTLQLATTLGGSAINFTGSTSGTHQAVATRYLAIKVRTDFLSVFNNIAIGVCSFFESLGTVKWQEIRNNKHIGNNSGSSRFAGINNVVDIPNLERCEWTNIEGNTSITNETFASPSILITNTRVNEYYSVNRNKTTPATNFAVVSESGATAGLVDIDSPYSNEILPSGAWSTNFNPPPRLGAFDIGNT